MSPESSHTAQFSASDRAPGSATVGQATAYDASSNELFGSLRLTRRERQLLAFLTQNPGKCFSRAFLMQTVWGYAEGVKSRTVDVHIRRLRSKLGAPGKGRIRTIVRVGYCWEPETLNHEV